MTQTKPAAAVAITVDGDMLRVERLELRDLELAAYVAERPEADRLALVERALRVGLLSLRNAGVTLNVDYVEKEFDRMMRRTDESREKAAEALETSLRETFADGDGRLPRLLESFLGDKGSLRRVVDELFDENRRDSAIGRMRTLLGGYFDGDGAIVARMLDPRRDESPLHGFRTELREALKDVSDRLLQLEAARGARAEERALGTAKGGDFADEVEARLAVIARGCGDVVEDTGATVGDSVRGRKGDFLLTLNPSWTRGLTVKVAIEAKSGPVGLVPICRELDEAKRNRSAAVAVVVYPAGCAPTGCAPLNLHGDHVLCELDVDDPDDCILETAIRLARALALAQSRERAGDLDVVAVRRHLESVRSHLKVVASMKSKLTSVAGVTGEVSAALDTLRSGVLDCVLGVEEEMSRGDTTAHQDVA